MGKETKIGLGVIAALLIVLVVVLTLRLTGPRDDTAASAKANGNAAAKTKAAPAPRPVATKVVARKPTFVSGKHKGFQMSSPRSAGNKGAARSNISDKTFSLLPPPLPAGDESRQSAGWANAGGQSSPTQSGSSMFVLDPPDPPRASAGSAAHTRQYTPTQRYDRQRPRAGQPVYQSVSQSISTTRGGVEPRNYGGYRGNYGGQSRYGSQYATTPPPVVPRSMDASSRSLITAPRADGTYEVQPNDNYWQISKSIYGSGAYFKALAEHNRKDHPVADRLRVGDTISAPALAELVDGYPDFCPSPRRRKTLEKRASVAGVSAQYGGGSAYAVQNGDTLYDIARYELGDASRWVEIYELNRHVIQGDFDYLTPGMKLVMPREATGRITPDSITQRPALYQPSPRTTRRR